MWSRSATFLFVILVYSACEDEAHPTPTVTDIDGNVYNTVEIGNQVWMAENLIVRHYNNGDEIPQVFVSDIWDSLSSGGCAVYANYAEFADTYGLLNNWFVINDARGLAPAGWRIANDNDWQQLETYLGLVPQEAGTTGWRGTDVGGQLKQYDIEQWGVAVNDTIEESGFDILPGGYRDGDWGGSFQQMNIMAFFWTSTPASATTAWYRQLHKDVAMIYRSAANKQWGCSVRCIKIDD